jgi:hypothetical protein
MPGIVRRAIWFYKNYSVKDLIVKVGKHPMDAFLNYLISKKPSISADDLSNLAEMLGTAKDELQGYANEILKDKTYQCFGTIRTKEQVLYCVTRHLKPEKVVETGVFNGYSTYAFLKALNRNKKGFLYSIDLPSYFESKDVPPELRLPKGKHPGWAVPDYLKDRWGLILGKSKEKLPPLLERLGQIDIFCHDSEHTYENMMFEYKTAFPYIRKGGILISDDITYNSSFYDFVSKYSLTYLKLKSEEQVGLCIHP